jgi:hypothetical protein
MAIVYSSPEDIVNAGLTRVGYAKRIGNIFEGSPASVAALQIYSQERDARLRAYDWGFAERQASLSLLKTAPVGGYTPAAPWTSANPLLPWIYEYAYPIDMLKLRSLRAGQSPVPGFDPRPSLFRIANDTVTGTQQKVILSNLEAAIAVYTAQVTNPTLWEADFTETLVDTVGRALAPILAKIDQSGLAAQKLEALTAEAEAAQAAAVEG